MPHASSATVASTREFEQDATNRWLRQPTAQLFGAHDDIQGPF